MTVHKVLCATFIALRSLDITMHGLTTCSYLVALAVTANMVCCRPTFQVKSLESKGYSA